MFIHHHYRVWHSPVSFAYSYTIFLRLDERQSALTLEFLIRIKRTSSSAVFANCLLLESPDRLNANLKSFLVEKKNKLFERMKRIPLHLSYLITYNCDFNSKVLQLQHYKCPSW